MSLEPIVIDLVAPDTDPAAGGLQTWIDNLDSLQKSVDRVNVGLVQQNRLIAKNSSETLKASASHRVTAASMTSLAVAAERYARAMQRAQRGPNSKPVSEGGQHPKLEPVDDATDIRNLNRRSSALAKIHVGQITAAVSSANLARSNVALSATNETASTTTIALLAGQRSLGSVVGRNVDRVNKYADAWERYGSVVRQLPTAPPVAPMAPLGRQSTQNRSQAANPRQNAPQGQQSRVLGPRTAVDKAIIDLDLALKSGNKRRIDDARDTLHRKVDALTVYLGRLQNPKYGMKPPVLPKPAAIPIGPSQGVDLAKQRLIAAQQSGNYKQIFDAQINYARKLNALNRAQKQLTGPSWSDRLIDAFMTSRFGLSSSGHVQMMPLVNRVMRVVVGNGLQNSGGGSNAITPMVSSLLKNLKAGGVADGAGDAAAGMGLEAGVGGAAGGAAAGLIAVAGAAAVVVGGLYVMYKATQEAMDRIVKYTKLRFAGGGDTGETGMAMRLGDAFGIDISGAIEGLGDRLTQGGAAAAFARRLGVNPNGNIFGGDMNYTRKFITIVEKLTDPNVMNDAAARRIAKAMGLTDLLYLRDASPGMRNRLFNQMNAEQYDPATRQQAVDSQISLNLAMSEFSKMVTQLGIVGLPYLTAAGYMIIDMIKQMQLPLQIINALLPGRTGIADPMIPGMHNHTDKTNARDQKARDIASRDRNTDAIDRMTQALNGVYGGGQRTRGAIPSSWGMVQIDNQAMGHGIQMGGFAL